MPRVLHAIPASTLVLALSALSNAQFDGLASCDTAFTSGKTVTGTTPLYGLHVKDENEVGGDGGAFANLNWWAGQLGTSTHGCVGPSLDAGHDNAFGNGHTIAADTLVVTSSVLPFGTLISLRICVDVASHMEGVTENPDHVATGRVENGFSLKVGGFSTAGIHRLTNKYTTINNSGEFIGQVGHDATYSHDFDINAQVGHSFNIRFSLTSYAEADASANLSASGVADGNGGIGGAVGLESITDGVTLFSTQLQTTWTGQCGGAADLIPPNPVESTPEPASMLAISGGVAMVLRRRSSRRSRE